MRVMLNEVPEGGSREGIFFQTESSTERDQPKWSYKGAIRVHAFRVKAWDVCLDG